MKRENKESINLAPEKILEDICRYPWKHYLKPFQIAPKVFYVSGNDWVGAYLIETEEGLILIDTGMHETCYLLLESIRELGYTPYDIKKILISHAHIDHIGAAKTLKELINAQIYIGKRDVEPLTKRKDLILKEGSTCGDFVPDKVYEEENPIIFGGIKIYTYSTPGHTPGCTSFIFERKDKEGKKYICGMHGGIGLNTLSRKYLKEKQLPLNLQNEFLESLLKLAKFEVDICIPSHTNQIEILDLIPEDRKNFLPFVNKEIWHKLINERIEKIREILNEK